MGAVEAGDVGETAGAGLGLNSHAANSHTKLNTPTYRIFIAKLLLASLREIAQRL
jgi:hypothetical protein